MKKTEIQECLREAHKKLTGALEGLSEEEATRTGLNAQWSVKDALAHISAWEIEGARIIREIQEGT
ncbi:MAG: maleylpyruvate isomerase N-terminal domain-containing protein, partial [Acidobacteria bacterium]|nr:maleylpyruvate isomerase N-terminal domain-containing protein [Acidobacteriota bacterium]